MIPAPTCCRLHCGALRMNRSSRPMAAPPRDARSPPGRSGRPRRPAASMSPVRRLVSRKTNSMKCPAPMSSVSWRCARKSSGSNAAPHSFRGTGFRHQMMSCRAVGGQLRQVAPGRDAHLAQAVQSPEVGHEAVDRLAAAELHQLELARRASGNGA